MYTHTHRRPHTQWHRQLHHPHTPAAGAGLSWAAAMSRHHINLDRCSAHSSKNVAGTARPPPISPPPLTAVDVVFSPVKIFMGSYITTHTHTQHTQRGRDIGRERASEAAILWHFAALWHFSLHTFWGRQLHNIIIQ